MKITVVTPYFYPETGGVANHTYNLYKKISDKNIKVIIIISGKEKKITKDKIKKMEIYRLPVQFKISNTPISFKWKKQISEIIKKEKPAVILGHMPVTFICDVTLPIALKEKIPFIIKYHHGGSMLKGKFPIDIIIWIYEKIFLKKILKKSSKIITSSDFVTNSFMKDYSNKTTTITPGVDLKKFKPKETNVRNNVLFVANLKKSEDYKGLNFLLESIKLIKEKIPEVKLTVIGEGNYRGYYETLCDNLGIHDNVIFKGNLNQEKISKEYQNTNILVLPSLFESFGMVLIEAMACKKAVIGTDVGGIPYVIDNGKNGLLVPPKNSRDLSKAIMKLLEDLNLSKKMGENGYNKVKKYFTWNKKSKETLKVIDKVR